MKSAKKHIHAPFLRSFAFLLAFLLLFTSCEWSSFVSPMEDAAAIPSGTVTGSGTGQTEAPNTQPNIPIFYNRYTGLACDEAISSCRPLSVCVGNFDGKEQEGLSFAEILIEAPVDGDATRLWAITTNWSSISSIKNISPIKSYMVPMVHAFGSIAAYAGTSGSITSAFDAIDYASGEFTENFSADGSLVTSSGNIHLNAAIKKNYNMQDSLCALPYRLCDVDAPYSPIGNRISSLHFAYSAKNTVDFAYDAASNTYLKSSSGAAHTDPLTGTQLSFSNVIILFYNVSYYHTANGTSFTLDTTVGGSGFCYTGGGVVPIKWGYDSVGTLVFANENGEPLTINRGKTYIGMLKITDSTSVVAR